MYICIFIYIYIYVYIDSTYIYIYIFVYIYKEPRRNKSLPQQRCCSCNTAAATLFAL